VLDHRSRRCEATTDSTGDLGGIEHHREGRDTAAYARIGQVVLRTCRTGVMQRRGRIDGGRLEAWKAALAHLQCNRGLVAQCGLVILGATVVINMPFVPAGAYQRGLTTGLLVTGFLWILAWFAWVTSGLAFRIQGTLAQDAVTAQLRKGQHVFDVVASFKFDKRDVDQVIITPAGVTAVETKWHSTHPSDDTLLGAADQVARNARSMRHQLPSLATTGLPAELVTAALVVCGPGSHKVKSTVVTTGLGPVDLVTVADLDRWLAKRGRGLVGPDFARTLASELHELAVSRDKASVNAGPVLRWLSRVK
jgi:hypothetical protein